MKYTIRSIVIIIMSGCFALILQSISPAYGSLVGPFFGAEVGVILGFIINDNHRKKLEDQKRAFFKNLLLHEAKESIRLIGGTVNLIPIDAWNSIVNSGDIALFKDKAIDLSDTYFQIQNYNYEAKRVRDAIEETRLHPSTTDIAHASKLKESFDKRTKPATLERLKDLEEWITRMNVESGHYNLTGRNVNLIHRGRDGKEIPSAKDRPKS